jgi:DNA invertase Pin-like site-specific DNA recombinase
MPENYCALAISIIKGCSPEQAFDLYYEGRMLPISLTDKRAETEDMIALNCKGMSFAEIGDIFGLARGTVGKRIKRGGKK